MLENVDEEEFYDEVPLKLDNDLKSIEKRLLNKLKNKKSNNDSKNSPFRESKMSMPQINTNEKFYSTRSTSSSSMLPFITHSSIRSGLSNNIRSPTQEPSDYGLVRNNRYGDFDIGSLKRSLEKEMVENDNMLDSLRISNQ